LEAEKVVWQATMLAHLAQKVHGWATVHRPVSRLRPQRTNNFFTICILSFN